MLTIIPCLLTFAGMAVVDFEVWAPEPIEFCIVTHYKQNFSRNQALYFDCKTEDGSVQFWVTGVNKA